MKKALVLSVLAAFALSGCAVVHPLQAGGVIEKNSGKKVTAVVKKKNWFGFTPMSMDIAESAIVKLQEQCDGGNVTGIAAISRVKGGFFGATESVEVSGYCAQ